MASDLKSARVGLSTPLHDQFGGPLSLLMAIVGILLLLACANLGGMSLARGAGLLLRTVMSGTRTVGAMPQLHVGLDARVIFFTTAVTLAAALLFGLAPALTAFGSVPIVELRAGRGGTSPRSRRRFGSVLVVAQVALSLALVSVGQLYVAHLGALRDQSLGFDRRGVLLVSVNASAWGRRVARRRLSLWRSHDAPAGAP